MFDRWKLVALSEIMSLILRPTALIVIGILSVSPANAQLSTPVCTGGTASWNYGDWYPVTGCGVVAQSRTAVCLADANSGTKPVVCIRTDGTVVDDSFCPGVKPSDTVSCTPTTVSCAATPVLSQSVQLTNGCDTYLWQTSAWSACSGTGAWSYSAWQPTLGSACTASLAQTRTGTCAAGSAGEQSRTVTCVDNSGTTVVDSLCSNAGMRPAVIQSCSVSGCGIEGDLTQTVADYSGCTYDWQESGFGACVGGQANIVESQWLPSSGCGSTVQTRTVSCTSVPLSGAQTQTVSCRRSDGVTVVTSNCPGIAPATSHSCTPPAPACSEPTNQTSFLTGPQCPAPDATICQSNAANNQFCIKMPLAQ